MVFFKLSSLSHAYGVNYAAAVKWSLHFLAVLIIIALLVIWAFLAQRR
jgi:hypothetical protein